MLIRNKCYQCKLIRAGTMNKWCKILTIKTRCGVEDTRLKAKDTKKIPGQGQPFRGQTLSRPRTKDTSASALQKKKGFHKNFSGDFPKKKRKKRSSQKFFQAISKKKGLHKNFSSDLHKILTNQKIVLSSPRGQANFRGLEASRPRPRTSKCVLEDSTSDKNLSGS